MLAQGFVHKPHNYCPIAPPPPIGWLVCLNMSSVGFLALSLRGYKHNPPVNVDILQLLNLPRITWPIHILSTAIFSKMDAQNYLSGVNLSPNKKCLGLESFRNHFALNFKRVLYKSVCKTQEHTFPIRNKKPVMSQQLMHY